MAFLSLLFRSASKNTSTVLLSPQQALTTLRESIKEPSYESFDIILRLGVDPTRGDQMVKGNVFMPSGTGKQRKIAVFIAEEHKAYALKLGATKAGDELLKELKDGKICFEQVLATEDMASALKPFSRMLGQRGLMPTTRNNTLISFENLEKEMERLKKGMIRYRLNRAAMILSQIAKVRLTDEEVMNNLSAFMHSVHNAKPKNFTKKYLLNVFLTTTYGKSLEIDTQWIDPAHYNCVLPKVEVEV